MLEYRTGGIITNQPATSEEPTETDSPKMT